MSFLTIQNLYHCFFDAKEARLVLADIQLQVEQGEFISFLGPSGCGKTTLLSIIAGLLQPLEGTIEIEGERVRRPTSSIGYMLQQDYLFPWKTIEENIMTGLRITGIYSEEKRMKTLKQLDEVGLKNVEKLYPRQLSGGMRQRVALVRTLATNPKMLLLDEPFSALDHQTKIKLEELVYTLLKQFKKTAILVTHDIEEAISMSDRIFLLHTNPGRIAKTILVPEDIRLLSPFQARQHPKFRNLFQSIWRELERLEV